MGLMGGLGVREVPKALRIAKYFGAMPSETEWQVAKMEESMPK